MSRREATSNFFLVLLSVAPNRSDVALPAASVVANPVWVLVQDMAGHGGSGLR